MLPPKHLRHISNNNRLKDEAGRRTMRFPIKTFLVKEILGEIKRGELGQLVFQKA